MASVWGEQQGGLCGYGGVREREVRGSEDKGVMRDEISRVCGSLRTSAFPLNGKRQSRVMMVTLLHLNRIPMIGVSGMDREAQGGNRPAWPPS